MATTSAAETLGTAIRVALRAIPIETKQSIARQMVAPLDQLKTQRGEAEQQRTSLRLTSDMSEMLGAMRTAVGRVTGNSATFGNTALIRAGLLLLAREMMLRPKRIGSDIASISHALGIEKEGG